MKKKTLQELGWEIDSTNYKGIHATTIFKCGKRYIIITNYDIGNVIHIESCRKVLNKNGVYELHSDYLTFEELEALHKYIKENLK